MEQKYDNLRRTLKIWYVRIRRLYPISTGKIQFGTQNLGFLSQAEPSDLLFIIATFRVAVKKSLVVKCFEKLKVMNYDSNFWKWMILENPTKNPWFDRQTHFEGLIRMLTQHISDARPNLTKKGTRESVSPKYAVKSLCLAFGCATHSFRYNPNMKATYISFFFDITFNVINTQYIAFQWNLPPSNFFIAGIFVPYQP